MTGIARPVQFFHCDFLAHRRFRFGAIRNTQINRFQSQTANLHGIGRVPAFISVVQRLTTRWNVEEFKGCRLFAALNHPCWFGRIAC